MKIIALDGIDGTGKTTNGLELCNLINKHIGPCVYKHFPDLNTKLGKIADDARDPFTKSWAHVTEMVEFYNQYNKTKVIAVVDRWFYSTFAYTPVTINKHFGYNYICFEGKWLGEFKLAVLDVLQWPEFWFYCNKVFKEKDVSGLDSKKVIENFDRLFMESGQDEKFKTSNFGETSISQQMFDMICEDKWIMNI